MSQAFPGKAALSVKGSSPAKGTVVTCQQPTLPAGGKDAPAGQGDPDQGINSICYMCL